ncbi:superoxide dismutase [Candidatus Uhrbacteria bacterium RIFCSPHIGHO2_12_FULL_57_11]|uniref:Superoxide dismutase n=1 Tax=Candidatus Uhrbacteria bacterium RIFCSPHIGHO2_12_FULL_57_11 TaxID=1802398 RepID=A0A1F7UIA6_9BACT|nr:MAG: superoxide dismutase [Candidatus Uhrbacteria bacterium RIFCSPHIGHO2_12_FULL_57_11]
MPYVVKPLPFSDLKGISVKTMEIHHGKLYAGYVGKRNEIEEKLKSVDLAAANQTYSDLRSLKVEETFAGNGVVLHEAYFGALGGKGGKPSGALAVAIEKEWGAAEKWEAEFKACGLAVRGWVVLAYDTNDRRLHNYVGDAHNQGGMWGAIPLLVLDVYEHAYFIDFGSDRKKYIEDYMSNVNWKSAEEIYDKLIK